MTHTEIIYRRRIVVLAYAQRTKNVAETCRTFGISRTRYYEWKNRADLYGLEALMPKERRSPQMPSATPTHLVAPADHGRARAHHRLSPIRRSAGRPGLCDRQVHRAKAPGRPWAGKALAAVGPRRGHHGGHDGTRDRGGPRRRALRLLLGQRRPRELVCVDSFYIGRLKGVGKVYQLSAIDVFTRLAFVWLVTGTPDATVSVRFLDRLLRHYRRHGIKVRAVLSDNGPEYNASAFNVVVAKG